MLSDEDKGYIRTLYRQAAHPQKQIAILAQLYAVPKKEIRRVLGLIETPPERQRPQSHAVNRRVWTTDVRQAVIDRVLSGMSCRHAGAAYGVSAPTVGQWMSWYWLDHPEEAKEKRK